MSVGVKGGTCRLNTKQNGWVEWEEKYAGSASVYAGVLKSPTSHEKLSLIMWYMMTCAPIGTSKIPLFPQYMFFWDCGS